MGSRSTTDNTEPETKAAPQSRAASKTAGSAKSATKSAAKTAGTRAAKAADPAGEAAVKAPKKPGQAKKPRLTADDRHRLIAEAAYYSAQKRGFHPGMELEDWLRAETEVDRLLADITPATH